MSEVVTKLIGDTSDLEKELDAGEAAVKEFAARIEDALGDVDVEGLRERLRDLQDDIDDLSDSAADSASDLADGMNDAWDDVESPTREVPDQVDDELDEAEDRAQQFADSVTDIFQKVGAAIAAYFAVQKIVQFFESAISEAMEAESAFTKLEAMIKVTGGSAKVTAEEIADLGREIQNTTRFSDDSVVATAALLMRYKSLQGEGLERTIKLSADLAVLMGGDLRSAAQQLGRALEAPEHATRILRMAGISLTETQEKQIKNFVELGEKAKAQEIVFGLLEERVGGLATSMDDLETKNAKLNNQLGEVKETIGGALLPILHELVETAEIAGDAYAAFGDEMARAIGKAKENGGLESINELIVDQVVVLATLTDQWRLLQLGIARAGVEAAKMFQEFMEGASQRSAQAAGAIGGAVEDTIGGIATRNASTLGGAAGSMAGPLGQQIGSMIGESISEAIGDQIPDIRTAADIIQDTMEVGHDTDFLGLEGTAEALDEDIRATRERIAGAEERIRADMAARKAKREGAGEKGAGPSDTDKMLTGVDAELEAMAAEEAARLRRDVETHGPRNRIERDPSKLGFGQGSGGKETPDDVFQASFMGLEELNKRVQASAASGSATPEKKIEDAVVKKGTETVEAVEKVEKQLKPIEDIMAEQLDLDRRRFEMERTHRDEGGLV